MLPKPEATQGARSSEGPNPVSVGGMEPAGFSSKHWAASGVDVAGKEWAFVGDREAAEAQSQAWREAGWPYVRDVVQCQ